MKPLPPEQYHLVSVIVLNNPTCSGITVYRLGLDCWCRSFISNFTLYSLFLILGSKKKRKKLRSLHFGTLGRIELMEGQKNTKKKQQTFRHLMACYITPLAWVSSIWKIFHRQFGSICDPRTRGLYVRHPQNLCDFCTFQSHPPTAKKPNSTPQPH